MAASMPEGTGRLAVRSWVGARASGTGRNSSACRRPQRRWWKMLVEDAGGIRMPASSTTNIPGGTMTASSRHTETAMRALFVRSEEHTSELQSLMRISYAVFCLKKKKKIYKATEHTKTQQIDNKL